MVKTGYEGRIGMLYGFLAIVCVGALFLGVYSVLAGPIRSTSHVVRVDTGTKEQIKAAEDTVAASAESEGVHLESQTVLSTIKGKDKTTFVIKVTSTSGQKFKVTVVVARTQNYQGQVIAVHPTQ